MNDELPYPALDLIKRVAEHPFGWKRGIPRWSAVGNIFSTGSGSSMAICKAAGVDPHEIKGKKPLKP